MLTTSTPKATLRESIEKFINNHRGQKITNQDIINYFYNTEERATWSFETREDISKKISAVLCNKQYLGKLWRRVDRGLYCSLSPKK